MEVVFQHKGSFSNLEKFLNKIKGKNYLNILHKYGQEGVAALAAATPVDTGLTASSWKYEIIQNGSQTSLSFSNTNVKDGHNIAILIQYGHGTGTGGYVVGRDYINPAIRPIFERLSEELRKELK